MAIAVAMAANAVLVPWVARERAAVSIDRARLVIATSWARIAPTLSWITTIA